MAKSRIIKDLANGEVDTVTALRRAKVLLADLGNAEILEWINNEITGYPEDAVLPSYRITSGCLMGTYIRGISSSFTTFKNVPIPLGEIDDNARETLLSIQFREGVDALKTLLEDSAKKDRKLCKVLPADIFPYISMSNHDPFMSITSAHIEFGAQCITDIFSAIENRLLDVFILLEKEFGCLDELDLDCESKLEEELQSISARVVNIIFNDNRVSIGDGNTIKDSTIASSVDENEL